MKKLFLATSAMVAAGLMANQAAAQMEVTLGGEIRFQAGYVFSEDAEMTGVVGMAGAQALGEDAAVGGPAFEAATTPAERSGDFRALIDNIHIDVTATADNGLTYGGNARIAGGADRAQFFVSGAFGTVQLGDWDSAAHNLNLQVPHSGRDRFAGDINAYILNAGVADSGTLGAGGTKIVYLSEGTALDDTGFTLGLSYAPNSADEGGDVDRGADNFTDVGTVGVKFDREFSGVNVRAGAGYVFGNASGDDQQTGDGGGQDYFVENNGNTDDQSERNLSAFNVGAGIGFGAFDVGAHYIDRGDSGQIKGFSDRTWSAGATYTVGPWAFGVSYADGEQSVSVSGENAAGAATSANYTVSEQRLGLGTTYSVAPGLVLAGDLGYNRSDWSASGDIDPDAGESLDNKAWVGLVTTRLTF